jgi:hypothetical protein
VRRPPPPGASGGGGERGGGGGGGGGSRDIWLAKAFQRSKSSGAVKPELYPIRGSGAV